MPHPDLMAEYMRLIGFILLAVGLATPAVASNFIHDARLHWRCRHWQGVWRCGTNALVTVAVALLALAGGIVLLFWGVQV